MALHIVFDMDNTLADEFGKGVRPGIVDLLQKLSQDGHTLSLWTSSTKPRAVRLLRDLGLREFFGQLIAREDYDPDNQNVPKDIRRIGGEILIDDDPMQIEFVQSIGLRGELVTPYRPDSNMDDSEMIGLYDRLFPQPGFFSRLFKR